MDKGLDIAERRCVLALHAAAPDSPRQHALFARALINARFSVASVPTRVRQLESHARQNAISLAWDQAERSLRWAESERCEIITIFDPTYPPMLAEIARPPIVLFVQGDLGALAKPQIAVVGSRKPSHSGLEAAFEISGELVEAGFIVTSGMATGIDGAAHRGALERGGQTVAVFGCGIERIYPRVHRRLATQIIERGAVVSEFPLASSPRPYHFPRRNRVISGLSRASFVVEAAARSGSISTAMHALDQGRDVFAMPGSRHNPVATGCHELLKQGATLAVSAKDIIAHYDDMLCTDSLAKQQDHEPPLVVANEPEQLILEACGYDGASFDDIIIRTGLTATEVSSILSALEVRGLASSQAGNIYFRVSSKNSRNNSGRVSSTTED